MFYLLYFIKNLAVLHYVSLFFIYMIWPPDSPDRKDHLRLSLCYSPYQLSMHQRSLIVVRVSVFFLVVVLCLSFTVSVNLSHCGPARVFIPKVFALLFFVFSPCHWVEFAEVGASTSTVIGFLISIMDGSF